MTRVKKVFLQYQQYSYTQNVLRHIHLCTQTRADRMICTHQHLVYTLYIVVKQTVKVKLVISVHEKRITVKVTHAKLAESTVVVKHKVKIKLAKRRLRKCATIHAERMKRAKLAQNRVLRRPTLKNRLVRLPQINHTHKYTVKMKRAKLT